MINRSFLLLWLAVTISMFGSSFTVLVLQITAVSELNASPFEMGIFGAGASLAAIVFGPVSGIVADRFQKNLIMVSADLFHFAVIMLCVGLIYFSRIEMHHLLAIWMAMSVGGRFFGTAFAAFLPSVVGRERLIDAHGKLVISESIAGVVGPAAGGLILAIAGSALALAIDASSYLLSAIAIVAVGLVGRSAVPRSPPVPVAEPFWPSLIAGFEYILKVPEILSLLIRGSILSGFNGAFSAVIFIYYLKTLDLDQFEIGLLSSALALGLFFGGACTRFVSGKVGVGPAIVVGNVLMAFIWIGLPFLEPAAAITVPILTGMYLCYGFLLALCSINSASLRQARTPDAVLGRVEAAYGTVTLCVNAGGALLMGLAAQFIEMRAALAGLAFLAIFCALLGLRSRTLLAIRDVMPGPAPV